MDAKLPNATGTPLFSGDIRQFGTTELRLRALVSIDDVVNAAQAWRALDHTTRAPNCFFQSYEWCKSWLVHHADKNIQPLVLIVMRGDDAIAILPMMQVKTWKLVHVLRPLGEPHTQYAGVLTLDGRLDEDVIHLLRNALFERPSTDVVLMQYVPSGSPLRDILGTRSQSLALANEASQFDLSVFASADIFTSAMTSRRRQAKRRAVAALHDDGDLRLKVIWPNDIDFAEAAMQCLTWKNDWISQTGRMNSGLSQKGHAEFLSSIPGSALQGGAVIFALCAGARPVAYQLGFIYRQQYHLYTASFDWSLRRWSLGTVLIDMTINWLISHDVKIFDLMGNPAPYKENWSNKHLQLSGHVISLSAKGKLYSSLWNKRLRPALKYMFHHLPPGVRAKFVHLIG